MVRRAKFPQKKNPYMTTRVKSIKRGRKYDVEYQVYYRRMGSTRWHKYGKPLYSKDEAQRRLRKLKRLDCEFRIEKTPR